MRSFIIVCGVLLGFGCADERRYLGNDGVYQVALTMNTAPAFTLPGVDGADAQNLYIVETRVTLPVRRPSNTELGDLRMAAKKYAKLPFPRLPWVERGDIELQIDFTLTNLDTQAHEAAVIVNGFDEFFEYEPGVTVNDDQLVVDYSQWERLYKVEKSVRVSRTVREEELDEAATDLATVVNGAPNANEVVYFENQSAHDVRAQPYIPKVIPGLMGFRIGIRTTERAQLLLEASVRARDTADRLTQSGEPTFQVNPQKFTPMPVDMNQ